jgi:hypothetical protein
VRINARERMALIDDGVGTITQHCVGLLLEAGDNRRDCRISGDRPLAGRNEGRAAGLKDARCIGLGGRTPRRAESRQKHGDPTDIATHGHVVNNLAVSRWANGQCRGRHYIMPMTAANRSELDVFTGFRTRGLKL